MSLKRQFLYLRWNLLLFTVLLSFISCEPKDNASNQPCNSHDPLEEILWLKVKRHYLEVNMGLAGWQIIRYKYKGAYVFWIDPCYRCADNLITVYNCNGEAICEFGGIDGRNTCIDFETEATDSTMLIDNVQH